MNMKRIAGGYLAKLGVVVLAFLLTYGTCNPPPTVNIPASELGIKVNVLDVSESPSDGKVPVIVQFLSEGKFVRLGSSATVTCNGVTLKEDALGHTERVPIQPTGGTYSVEHKRSGFTTTVQVTVPPRPVFRSPTVAGASIARTSHLVIHYAPGGGTSVRGNASDGTTSRNNSQPDDGTHEGLDVSGFNAGPGRLSLTRNLTDTQHSGGGGFASVQSVFTRGRHIDITWL
jgi:hypothetical protein